MSNQFGFILSGPKYTLKPVEDIRQTPMREIYLENDHRAHYRVEERTKGKFLTGLVGMTASLSLVPSGAAVPLLVSTSIDRSSSFTSATSSVTNKFSSSIQGGQTQSFTSSFYTITSSSFTSSWTGSVTNSTLFAPMPETAYNSSEYLGTILGSNITMALSASLSRSFALSTSSSIATASVSTSFSTSAAITTSLHTSTTLSFVETTGSTTNSTEIPLPNTGRKVYEIITSGSHIKVSSPMILRSVRWLS